MPGGRRRRREGRKEGQRWGRLLAPGCEWSFSSFYSSLTVYPHPQESLSPGMPACESSAARGMEDALGKIWVPCLGPGLH